MQQVTFLKTSITSTVKHFFTSKTYTTLCYLYLKKTKTNPDRILVENCLLYIYFVITILIMDLEFSNIVFMSIN